MNMATVIISHKVKDYAKWRPFFDADLPRRQSAGFQNEKVFTAHDDPNNVFIIGELSDVKKFIEMKDDPGMRAIMEKAGVISEPSAIILKKA